MQIPRAFIVFLVYFQGVRDYFECHEILEDEWKKAPVKERQDYWKGFIAIAVSQYHHRRGNFKGALKAVQNAITRLKHEEELLFVFGLDAARLLKKLEEVRENILHQKPYKSIQLPIIDVVLHEECKKRSSEKGCVFGNESDMTDEGLIHKHRIPNRSSIISKREQLHLKKQRD